METTFTYEDDGKPAIGITSYSVYESPTDAVDKYTVIFHHPLFTQHNCISYLGCSVDGKAVSMWGELPISRSYSHLGKRLRSIPSALQRHINYRLNIS